VPGAMALAIRSITHTPLLFDVRGLMAEEYVDGGIWTDGNLAWRVTKWVERRCLRRAAAVVVLSERAKPMLFGPLTPRVPVTVIPCCVATGAFEMASARREQMRARLGLADRQVIAYAGKFSTWYLAREMAAFFAAAHARDRAWHFLVLTQSPHELIEQELSAVGVPPSAWQVHTVAPVEVAAYLSAADASISFIAAAPSKAASSPTKVGEYLAAGLPIVASAGVGDTDELLRRNGVGVVIEQHDTGAYALALDALEALLGDPSLGDRCRATARAELSLDEVGVPRYRGVYESLEAAR
jgi:glycosyltransferase involved in cell wall biosynthesis